MSTLVINDLPVGKELDREAMASIFGGGCGRRRKGGHGRHGRHGKGGYYKRVEQDIDIDIDIVGDGNVVVVNANQNA
jgi:hypothetical protein